MDSMLVTSTSVTVSLLCFSASLLRSVALGWCACCGHNAVTLLQELPHELQHDTSMSLECQQTHLEGLSTLGTRML